MYMQIPPAANGLRQFAVSLIRLRYKHLMLTKLILWLRPRRGRTSFQGYRTGRHGRQGTRCHHMFWKTPYRTAAHVCMRPPAVSPGFAWLATACKGVVPRATSKEVAAVGCAHSITLQLSLRRPAQKAQVCCYWPSELSAGKCHGQSKLILHSFSTFIIPSKQRGAHMYEAASASDGREGLLRSVSERRGTRLYCWETPAL